MTTDEAIQKAKETTEANLAKFARDYRIALASGKCPCCGRKLRDSCLVPNTGPYCPQGHV